MRINKYLADHKYASRREADTLISSGKVFINKRPAVLGDQVGKGDVVEVRGVKKGNPAYYAYYKPKGVVTFGAQYGDKEIKDIIKFPEKVYPLGRLDKDSEGLILFSNDGRVTKELLHPDSNNEKIYEVTVDRKITKDFIIKMRKGVNIGEVRRNKNYITKPVKIEKKDRNIFTITLTEGKNRQIRRMCGVFGYAVTKLIRIQILNVKLDNLKSGEYKNIKGEELQKFLKTLKII